MFLENNTPGKLGDNSEILSVKSGVNNISILEEDLALSSSTLASLQPAEKTSEDNDQPESLPYKLPNKVIYVNEETMDCSYSSSAGTPKIKKTTLVVSSPEMFNSDDDDDDDDDDEQDLDNDNGQNLNTKRSTFNKILSQPLKNISSPRKPSQEEMIIKSDSYLMKKMSKYLSGVPPPPKHTICQKDCNDFLSLLRENQFYFWIDTPFNDENPNNHDKKDEPQSTIVVSNDPIKSLKNLRGMRNLTDAFDACDGSSSCPGSSTADGGLTSEIVDQENNTLAEVVNSAESETTSLPPGKILPTSDGKSLDFLSPNMKRVTFDVPEEEHLAIFRTIDETHAKDLPWSLAYSHKAPGIHYNRNKYIEDFENLTVNLCERYIGNETQSTCSWFSKQAPNSARKRNLLGRRNVDKSPGKRLSYLARRRRTFSSANLQGMSDKRQFVVNIKKPGVKKGKSPRGKSPRGSAKKRLLRRLSTDNSSPRKSKLETSKRALFQSPPNDRAGPSRINCQNSSQKIKRALFSTISKKDDMIGASGGNEEKILIDDCSTKKRKNCDELEGPKPKWAKSLSFDCPHNLDKSKESWSDRYSTGNLKTQSISQPTTTEMSDTNRKKLLWAVSQALRSRGISMTHPKFKQYATQLAKMVKKFMPDLENHSIPKKSGSTTERMLKHAKNHVILIVDADK